MLNWLVDFLLGKKETRAHFIRSVNVGSNRGNLTLLRKQAFTVRRAGFRKNVGEPYWELQNTVAIPFFGRSRETEYYTALEEIFKKQNVAFSLVIDTQKGSHFVVFSDKSEPGS